MMSGRRSGSPPMIAKVHFAGSYCSAMDRSSRLIVSPSISASRLASSRKQSLPQWRQFRLQRSVDSQKRYRSGVVFCSSSLRAMKVSKACTFCSMEFILTMPPPICFISQQQDCCAPLLYSLDRHHILHHRRWMAAHGRIPRRVCHHPPSGDLTGTNPHY